MFFATICKFAAKIVISIKYSSLQVACQVVYRLGNDKPERCVNKPAVTCRCDRIVKMSDKGIGLADACGKLLRLFFAASSE